MKIALITDTHFGGRGDSPVFSEYIGRFYKEVFFPYLKDNKINNIIHLGDIVAVSYTHLTLPTKA